MLDMVPGSSGECDRRSVSAAVKHRRRTCQVESELGKGENTEQQEGFGVILDTRCMGQEAEHVIITDSGLDQQLLAQVWRLLIIVKFL